MKTFKFTLLTTIAIRPCQRTSPRQIHYKPTRSANLLAQRIADRCLQEKRKNMIRTLVILLMLPVCLSSQELIFSESKIIQNVIDYRSKLIKENIKSTDNLRILEKNWGELDPNNEEFELITLNLKALKSRSDYSANTLLRIVKKDCERCKLIEMISEQDIEIILENSELLDLVLEGVLKPNYPFAINPKSTIFSELEFYQIETGQRIGEIGAGNGTFSILLGMLSDEIQIVINELEKGFVNYIGEKISNNNQLLDASKIEVVKGTKSNTGLRDNQFDKIIIRNAFHHFSKKEKMLESIKESLSENGKLYLYEPILVPSGKGSSCDKVLDKQYLLTLIEENGFLLEKEKKLDNSSVLLRFSKK